MRTPFNKYGLILCLTLILALGTGCGDDPASPDEEGKSLSGKAILGGSGLPAAGAWIFLSEPNRSCAGSPPLYPIHSDSIQTDQAGNFRFPIERDVFYDIFAGLDGAGTPGRFSHISHPTGVDMTVGNSVTMGGLELHEVVAGASLSGTVNDRVAEDIAPGAAVVLWRREGIGFAVVSEAVADTAGEFLFSDLSTGIYRMSASTVSVVDSALVTDYWGPQLLAGGTDWGPMILNLGLPVLCSD